MLQAKWNPLHTFALAGQIKFMDGLLENGYDIDLVDKVKFSMSKSFKEVHINRSLYISMCSSLI